MALDKLGFSSSQELGETRGGAPAADDSRELGALIKSSSGDFPVNSEDDYRRDIAKIRYAGFALATAPALTAYLNGVLDRLIAKVPGAGGIGRMYLVPNPEFFAFALRNGAIFISLGAIRAVENEDELAALLAHEVSHLLYAHHNKTQAEEYLDRAFTYTELLHHTRDDGFNSDYRRIKAASWITSTILLPKWNRNQENQADLLGVDLMMSAGYDGDAMLGVLEMVKQASKAQKREISKYPVIVKPTSDRNNKLPLTINRKALLGSLKAAAEADLGKQYDSADDRMQAVHTYLRTAYADAAPVVPLTTTLESVRQDASARIQGYTALNALEAALDADASAPEVLRLLEQAQSYPQASEAYGKVIAYYAVRKARGDRRAQPLLRDAFETGAAPFFVYRRLAQITAQRREYSSALQYTAAADRTFGDTAELLPIRIQASEALGQSLRATMLRLQCLAHGDPALVQECNR